MSVILKAENISKQYRLGLVGTGTLTHDVNRLWHRIRGKEDPYLKVGAVNDRASKASEQYVWALRDIDFEVNRGEVLGIIGKNGAGKSTLLKLLSRVTSPTTGTIKTKGRIASLLEVGTGFHPELTGRENIFLNGAILGMRKSEIAAKLEEIVEFSGCEKYIDTPVKRYSSGMRVRLAFAVAAHLEPDILVVDEVLAVGDAEFQKKAIGKMQDISQGQGRTVLFVSHNMGSVKSLCKRGIVLKNGGIAYDGLIHDAIDFYLNQESNQVGAGSIDFSSTSIGNKQLQLMEVTAADESGRIRTLFMQSEDIHLSIKFKCLKEISGLRFNLRVKTVQQEDVFLTTSHELTKSSVTEGEHTLILKIPKYLLNKMRYVLSINAGIPGKEQIIAPLDAMALDIEGDNAGGSSFNEIWPGLVCPKIEWNYLK